MRPRLRHIRHFFRLQHIHMLLTCSHLATMLADSIGLIKVEARALVAAFYDELTRALETGEPVVLAGFGEFKGNEGRVSFSSALKA